MGSQDGETKIDQIYGQNIMIERYYKVVSTVFPATILQRNVPVRSTWHKHLSKIKIIQWKTHHAVHIVPADVHTQFEEDGDGGNYSAIFMIRINDGDGTRKEESDEEIDPINLVKV